MALERAVRRIVEELGFEFVSMERGGSSRRPFLRVRIDTLGGMPGRSGIGVEDCSRATRAIQGMLEEMDELGGDYVLEVSSPGVERPLVRPEDYDRFAGKVVRVRGFGPLAGGNRTLVGTLLGRVGEDRQAVALEVDGGRVEIPLATIAGARLVYEGSM